MPLQIGSVTIDDPVFLAPMSGVSDAPFRRLVKRYGAGLVFSEMIASRPAVEAYRRKESPSVFSYLEEAPIAVQIAGCEPELVAEAARINEARGASIIDINFGCPVKKVVHTLAGSALMRDLPLAARIIEATIRAVRIPVSVKMRLGWDEQSLNAPELARIAQDLGAAMVTVHGRTRNQLYNGRADWAAIRAVREAVSVPLIVNGDIGSAADAKKAMELSGADGVMVGRAAYGRPWLVRRILDDLAGRAAFSPPSRAQIGRIALEHYDMILGHYGLSAGVSIARKHLGWYSDAFDGSAEFRGMVNRSADPVEVRRLIRSFFIDEAAILARPAPVRLTG